MCGKLLLLFSVSNNVEECGNVLVIATVML